VLGRYSGKTTALVRYTLRRTITCTKYDTRMHYKLTPLGAR